MPKKKMTPNEFDALPLSKQLATYDAMAIQRGELPGVRLDMSTFFVKQKGQCGVCLGGAALIRTCGLRKGGRSAWQVDDMRKGELPHWDPVTGDAVQANDTVRNRFHDIVLETYREGRDSYGDNAQEFGRAHFRTYLKAARYLESVGL